MFKFFRRFRLQFLKDGSLKTYLLYAIGEIILVVIGILIALQIGDWSEEAKKRKLERQILSELRTELIGNKKQLDQAILDKEISLMVCQAILPSLVAKKNILKENEVEAILRSIPSDRVVYASANSSKLDSLLGSIPSYWAFLPSIGNIKAIIYSGNINYITKSELRIGIAEFEDRVKGVNFAINGADEILLEKIQPILRRNLTEEPDDFYKLLNDLDFRFHLRDYMGWMSSTVSVSKGFSRTMESMIANIEAEISDDQ